MFEVVCVGGWGGSVGDKKEIESGAVWMCVVGGWWVVVGVGVWYGCGVVVVKEYDENSESYNCAYCMSIVLMCVILVCWFVCF